MPVDTTRIIPTRRTQRQITEEELKDIELKRLRGELSCAECRRLKLKCDKKVPCGSCVRRGCESICPCGILSAGQGTRFILADTEQLHRKISDMSNRIRQLEDALAILQGSVSDQRHPLLNDNLLKIKFGSEAISAKPTSTSDEDTSTRQSIDALGTLTLDESGGVKYFGRSAGSETLMMASEESDPSAEDEEDGASEVPITLSPELENLANLFPFTSKDRRNTNSLELIESLLPAYDRAYQLCELYVGHAALLFRPVKQDELLTTILPTVYNTASNRVKTRITTDASPSSDNAEEPGDIDNASPHALAALLFIFAVGALLDLNLGPFNAQAEHYYDLGRAALSLRTVFDSPSINTVRALGLMATYHSLAGKRYSRDGAWCLMSFAAKVAQSIGLHRDSARWNMDPATVQIRRNLFWEVFASDVSHSLAIGRPPALDLSYVDCEFPLDEEATLSDAGETQNGFWRMKHIYARDIFTSVAEVTLGAGSPSYSTILELDRKVRETPFPSNFKPYISREEGGALFYSSSDSLKSFYASIHRTVTMLYLHRSFFAQAMLDHPANPLLSPFASSFLTAYRCASVIIKASAHQFERCAEIGTRVWLLLYHTFSAAVIAGTIVTRSSNSSVAPSALMDLDLAVSLFERAAVNSQRAKIALGALRKLKDKAHRAFSQFSSKTDTPHKPQESILGIFSSQAIDDVEDELAIFGGHTRVLDRKSKHKHTHSSTTTSSASSPQGDGSVSPPVEPKSILGPLGDFSQVHPSLVEYLNATTSIKSQQPSTVLSMAGFSSQYPMTTQISSLGGTQQDATNSFSNYSNGLSTNSINNANSSAPSATGGGLYNPSMQQGSSWQRPTPENPMDGRLSAFSWANSLAQTHTLPDRGGYTSFNGQNLNAASMWNPTSESRTQPFSGNTFAAYNTSYSVDYGLNPAAPTTAMGGMVEMGLSTESRLDAGWVSLMRDCGIMETDKPSF